MGLIITDAALIHSWQAALLGELSLWRSCVLATLVGTVTLLIHTPLWMAQAMGYEELWP